VGAHAAAAERVRLSTGQQQALQRSDSARRIGLFIGVGLFGEGAFSPLRHPASDARALADAFARGGDAGATDIEVLVGRRETRRDAILEALDRLEVRVQRPDDLVFVAISTHGELVRRRPGDEPEAYLAASDSFPGAALPSSGIPMLEIERRLERLRSRRHVALIAACHNERLKGALPGLLVASEASFLLYAASPGEPAVEQDDLGHDVYVHYFLEGLEHGDVDDDGAVSVTEAHDYATRRTFDRTNGLQRPRLVADVSGLDPIYLRGSPSGEGRPLLFAYAPQLDYLTLLVDGRPKGTLPAAIPVEAGEHTIALSRGRDEPPFVTARMSLAPGDRISLERLATPTRWRIDVAGGFAWPLGERPQRELGGATPALDLGASWEPSGGPWGLAVEAGFRSGDHLTPEKLPSPVNHWTVTVGAGPRLTLWRSQLADVAATATLGWRATQRDLGGATHDRFAGPAGSVGLAGRVIVGPSLGAVLRLSAGGAGLASAEADDGWLLDGFLRLAAGLSWST